MIGLLADCSRSGPLFYVLWGLQVLADPYVRSALATASDVDSSLSKTFMTTPSED